MVGQVRNLFYALAVHGLLHTDDADMAALSYAMTIHALIDHQLDLLTAQGVWPPGVQPTFSEVRAYVSWFARQMEGVHA